MQRFYKMWLEQLYHHLKLMNSPSHSTATVPQHQGRGQGQLQNALKQKAEPIRWSLDALLPWLTLLVMVAWLVMQSSGQSQGFSRFQHSLFGSWSNSSSVLPNLVPVSYPAV